MNTLIPHKWMIQIDAKHKIKHPIYNYLNIPVITSSQSKEII